MQFKAVDDAVVRVEVVRVRQSQAPSRGFHVVLTVEGDRDAGLKELSARQLARPPSELLHALDS